jgi:hypothetical protein
MQMKMREDVRENTGVYILFYSMISHPIEVTGNERKTYKGQHSSLGCEIVTLRPVILQVCFSIDFHLN